jgi:hypothetical protein
MNKFREQLLHDPNSSFSTQSSLDDKQLFITSSTNISGVLDSENDIILDGNFQWRVVQQEDHSYHADRCDERCDHL